MGLGAGKNYPVFRRWVVNPIQGRGIRAVEISESVEVPGTGPIQADKITPTGKRIGGEAGRVAP